MDENKESLHLEEDFPPPAYDEWVKTVEASLKGKPFEKAMFTKTSEGITLKPIYRKEDLEDNPLLNGNDDKITFHRGDFFNKKVTGDWKVSQELDSFCPNEMNDILKKELELGLDEINIDFPLEVRKNLFSLENAHRFIFNHKTDMEKVFEGIDLSAVSLRLNTELFSYAFFPLLDLYREEKNLDPESIKGTVCANPLTVLAESGVFGKDVEKCWDDFAEFILWMDGRFPNMKVINLSSRPFHDGGAHICSELAYAFCQLSELVGRLSERNVSMEIINKHVHYEFMTDSNLFMEIAKLRAARIIHGNVMKNMGIPEEDINIDIYSRSSWRNKTVNDPYVNMLRSATETFSAVIGGADRIHTGGFNDAFSYSTPFSRRIARNQQLILKEESHFDFIGDPGAGSWYVESITKEIADRTWEIMGELDEKGFYGSFIDGDIQREIEKQGENELEKMRKRRKIMVGINQFANPEEEIHGFESFSSEKIEKRTEEIHERNKNDVPLKDFSREESLLFNDIRNAWRSGAGLATIFNCFYFGHWEKKAEGVKKTRFAQEYEELRRRVDQYEKDQKGPLKLFLLNMGPISQHKARADFSASFFQAGGFKVVNPKGFMDAEEAVEALKKSGAAAACLCSTDDAYPELVKALAPLWSSKTPNVPVLLAGFPKEHIDEFKDQGVFDFIHIRANAYEVLARLLKKIGVLS